MPTPIPLQRPYLTGAELDNVASAINSRELAGNGLYTKSCRTWLEARLGVHALITQSGTAGLEMAMLCADLAPGDEVLTPSFTFPSTANAIALRRAVPVFVDIRADTLNIDESKIEAAITPKTRAICVVHYAGVACDMEPILEIARAHKLLVIEDAAHAIGASWRDRPLGSIGDMAAFSFHETKNIVAGQGGAFLAQSQELFRRAEIILEKGTDRAAFLRGDVQKYSWRTLGSGYLPSEMNTAFLAAQLQAEPSITAMRLEKWARYHDRLTDLESDGLLRRPVVPNGCTHNAHIYYVLLESSDARSYVLDGFRAEQIGAAFHYVPLHDAPAGKTYGRASGPMTTTNDASARLLRLPLFADITEEQQSRVMSLLADRVRAYRASAHKAAG